jgi:hypothetical protein
MRPSIHESETFVSGWSVDTLHAHMIELLRGKDLRDQQRFVAQQEAVTAALAAAEKAVTAALTAADRAVAKAEAAADKRFDSVNEFRGALTDSATKNLTRLEADSRFESMADKIEVVNSAVAKIRDFIASAGGKTQAFSGVAAMGVALLSILVSIGVGIYSNRPYGPDPTTMGDIAHQLQQLNQHVSTK